MELTLTTGLAYADVGRALMAAFPGEGVTARPGAEEGTVDIVLDNPAHNEAAANAAIAAWSGGAAALGRAQAEAVAALNARRQQAFVAFAYEVEGTSYPVSIDLDLKIDVQAKFTLLTLAGEGATTDWELVNGVYFTWTMAELEAFGLAVGAYSDACYANSKAKAALINAATTPEAAAAVGIETGWPAP